MERVIEYTDKGSKKHCRVFDKIENNFTAYLIGYMACDGGYINSKHPFMMVSSTEEHIINHFNNRYCPDRVVYNVGKKSSKKVTARNNVFELRFPAKMNHSFNKFGIFKYKKDRRIVGIKQDFLLPYLAGCIDADGFITVTNRKDCRTPRLRFFITHESELFLSDLQSIFERFNVPTTLRQHGDNVWRLQAQNTEKNKPFLDSLTPYLKNVKKNTMLNNYLVKYYEPQASDELLESENQSAAKPHDEEGSETK